MDFCNANVVGSLNKCIGSVTNKEGKKKHFIKDGGKGGSRDYRCIISKIHPRFAYLMCSKENVPSDNLHDTIKVDSIFNTISD